MIDKNNSLYMGVVVSTNDPEHRYRIKVRVPSLYGAPGHDLSFITDHDLPWARPGLFLGSSVDGSRIVPEKGSIVYVIFENGKLSKPVYLGVVPISNSELPEQYKDGSLNYQSLFTKEGASVIYQEGRITVKDRLSLPKLIYSSTTYKNDPTGIFEVTATAEYPKNVYSFEAGAFSRSSDFNPSAPTNPIFFELFPMKYPVILGYMDDGVYTEIEMTKNTDRDVVAIVPTSGSSGEFTFKWGSVNMSNLILYGDSVNSYIRINFLVSDPNMLSEGDELQIGKVRTTKSRHLEKERSRSKFRSYKRVILTKELIEDAKKSGGRLFITLDYDELENLKWGKLFQNNPRDIIVSRILRRLDEHSSRTVSSNVVRLIMVATPAETINNVIYRYVRII